MADWRVMAADASEASKHAGWDGHGVVVEADDRREALVLGRKALEERSGSSVPNGLVLRAVLLP